DQSKPPRCEQREGSKNANQKTAQFAAGPVRFDEELDSKSFKRKDGRIEHDAECDDIPVGPPELIDIAEYYFVGRTCVSQLVFFLGVTFHCPLDQRVYYATRAETDRAQERRTPVVVLQASARARV